MPADTTTSPSQRRIVIAQIIAYVAAWCLVAPMEFRRFSGVPYQNNDILGWPASLYWHAPLYLPLLLIAPAAWWVRRRIFIRRRKPNQETAQPWWHLDHCASGPASTRAWGLALCLAGLSLVVSAWVGRHFEDLPPGYHDEYSYLFQAKTFLAGKLSYPSYEAPRLFDQMHVLNEGRFASRYFPGTGLWMAPFVAWDHPYWGHWLAGALTVFLIFWSGRELGGDGTGLVAGLLTAVSPGMALFGNMLLAHHPTMVGLSLFLLAILRLRNRGQIGYAWLAGFGLSFAMLCRPMTAAGFGLPFGVAFAVWLIRGGRLTPSMALRRRLSVATALGGPILVGLLALYGYNRAITGDGLVMPYQLYTDIYTPRHVYGFSNVERGEENQGPRVLQKYDRWAENLTINLAAKNVAHRTLASLNWTLGIVPLVMAGVIFVIGVPLRNVNVWLIFAAIVSLHIVHIPYWYDGIMHWHYVFESGPLWALIFAVVTGRLFVFWSSADRPWMPYWWSALVLASVVMTYSSHHSFWPEKIDWTAKIEQEVSGIRFGRQKHAAFQNMLDQIARPLPAVVFVEHDPSDRHIDYVINDPALNSEVLVARYMPEQFGLEDLQRLFPQRTLFLFRAKSGEFRRLR